MEDWLNFRDSLFLVRYHWFWMLVALGIGAWVGWHTAIDRRKPAEPAKEPDAS